MQLTAVNVAVEDRPGVTAGGLKAKLVISITAETGHADGEAAFREHERTVVRELAERKRSVIATGGGLGANESNLASLKEHALVVCLWASPDKIWERVRSQTHRCG